jgi:hypothetical protein
MYCFLESNRNYLSNSDGILIQDNLEKSSTIIDEVFEDSFNHYMCNLTSPYRANETFEEKTGKKFSQGPHSLNQSRELYHEYNLGEFLCPCF